MKTGAWGVFLAVLLGGCSAVSRAHRTQETAALYAGGGAADGAAPRSLVSFAHFTLPDFVAFAHTNRPDVAQAYLAVSNAVLALQSVRAQGPLVPQVSAAGGYQRATQNRGTHFGSHMDGTSWGSLDVDLLLYDFGRNHFAEKAACEALLVSKQAYDEKCLAVFAEVAQAYFTLLCQDARLEAAHTNQFQYARHLARAEALLQNQEAQKLDVLRARLDLSHARHKMIAASNDVVTAEMDFLQALGLTREAASRDTLLPRAADCLSVAVRALEPQTLSAAQCLDVAESASPQLCAQRARVRAASHEVDWRIADLLPQLSLGTSLSFTDKVWNGSWAVDIVETLFTGYRKTLAVDAASAALADSYLAYDRLKQVLARDISVALAARDTAREQLSAARVSVAQARENLDTAQRQLHVGDISRIDFSDAVNAYVEALSARVGAFYAEQMAEAQLVRLMGVKPVYLNQSVGME